TVLIISGSYDIDRIFGFLNPNQNLFIDCANNIVSSQELSIPFPLKGLFISTSSQIFKNEYSDFEDFCKLFKDKTENLVLKENRGGSIWYDYATKKKCNIPCYITEVSHSVGIGDVFDVVSIVGSYEDFEDRLYLASWIAKEYAETTYVNNLKTDVGRVLKGPITELKELEGCFLPWEVRQKCHIYLAAPDFDYIDSNIFDKLEECLKYHNFTLHRPVKENGQLALDSTKADRRNLFNKDMALLESCNMVIAVLPYNDPGTLIEIGIACKSHIPTLLFDPNNEAHNCMLTELPDKICTDWDNLICEVFKIYSKMHRDGTI
ncbi:MAG: nucleoside 2-deoxyribosyltransferase, partial [Allobaculum sp.]|nr:nucleoside 2-deoxyribosyltransferase [Allobaculum sp.]